MRIVDFILQTFLDRNINDDNRKKKHTRLGIVKIDGASDRPIEYSHEWIDVLIYSGSLNPILIEDQKQGTGYID